MRRVHVGFPARHAAAFPCHGWLAASACSACWQACGAVLWSFMLECVQKGSSGSGCAVIMHLRVHRLLGAMFKGGVCGEVSGNVSVV